MKGMKIIRLLREIISSSKIKITIKEINQKTRIFGVSKTTKVNKGIKQKIKIFGERRMILRISIKINKRMISTLTSVDLTKINSKIIKTRTRIISKTTTRTKMITNPQ